ncbi:MAG: tetratricopeptide repeat protein [Cyanobacteria bacterium]|nr:tetratricopeptide repeat protein [Cyanobacteriota bacterium]
MDSKSAISGTLPATLPVALSEAVLAFRSGEALLYGPTPDWGIIQLAGPDAFPFLQNRSCNDVLALINPGDSQENGVLDRGGHIQGMFTVLRVDHETLWLLSEKTQIPGILNHLKKFLLLEKVRIEELESTVVFQIQGKATAEILTRLFEETKIEAASYYTIEKSLTGEEGRFLCVPATQVSSLNHCIAGILKTLKITPLVVSENPLLVQITRIEAGIPRFGVDMNTETLLPETGLETQAVSYTKGCYLGQETIARIKTYGAVQKALMGLVFAEGCVPFPETVFTADEPLPLTDSTESDMSKVNVHLTSACFSPTLNRWIALAYLNKTTRIPGKSLEFKINNMPMSATVTMLPFFRAETRAEKAQQLLQAALKQFAGLSSENEDLLTNEVIPKLREALSLDPNLIDAYEALGAILARLDTTESYEEAITLMHQLSERDPDRIMAHTNLSVYYMKLGDKERAEEEKAKATVLAMRQKAKEAGLTLLSPEEEQRKKEAATRQRIQLFLEALQYRPEDPLGNFGLGSAYLELNEFENAIPAFQKTIAAQATHSVAYLSLGKAFEGLNQLTEAEKIYVRGIEVAAQRRDLMPLEEMQRRLKALENH